MELAMEIQNGFGAERWSYMNEGIIQEVVVCMNKGADLVSAIEEVGHAVEDGIAGLFFKDIAKQKS